MNIAELLARPIAPGDWWETFPIKTVRVLVHTEDDDKDSEESVTFRVLYGPFSSTHTENAGETWKDQSDKVIDIPLNPHPPTSAAFALRVTKSRDGSPTGKGWKATFEMSALTEGGAEMPLYIDGDRNRPRSPKFTMGDGEQNPNDAQVMGNCKVATV